MIGIYKITNKINQKCYIGKSINIEHRFKKHKTDAFWVSEKNFKYDLKFEGFNVIVII